MGLFPYRRPYIPLKKNWSTIKILPSRESRHFQTCSTNMASSIERKKLLISQALCISTQIIFKRVLTHRQLANIKNIIVLFLCPSKILHNKNKIKTILMQNSKRTNKESIMVFLNWLIGELGNWCHQRLVVGLRKYKVMNICRDDRWAH